MLLEFYGAECPHCIKMASLIARLESEENVKVERYEVWHNDANAKKMEKYDKNDSGNTNCGGVPFFFNTETKRFICGKDSYENLKKLALGT